ncbi:hypothetical protein F4604DRAFT_1901317 [Suillus subluteus]|nr:hypothetical protein F4604DRAFT_1901317 [Suillus subluteus]
MSLPAYDILLLVIIFQPTSCARAVLQIRRVCHRGFVFDDSISKEAMLGGEPRKEVVLDRCQLELYTLNRVNHVYEVDEHELGFYWYQLKRCQDISKHRTTSLCLQMSAWPLSPGGANSFPPRVVKSVLNVRYSVLMAWPKMTVPIQACYLQSRMEQHPSNGPHSSFFKNVSRCTVALLLSESKFTTATLTRALGSSIPFLLMHLPSPLPVFSHSCVEEKLALLLEPLSCGAQGLLHGELDVRWEDNLGGGGWPGLWCRDKRVQSSTLDLLGECVDALEDIDRGYPSMDDSTRALNVTLPLYMSRYKLHVLALAYGFGASSYRAEHGQLQCCVTRRFRTTPKKSDSLWYQRQPDTVRKQTS